MIEVAARAFSVMRLEIKVLFLAISLISIMFLFRSGERSYQVVKYGTVKVPCDKQFDISKVQVVSWHPRILRYEHFLSNEECEYIKKKGLDIGLARSEVAAPNKAEANSARTSYGVFIEDDADYVLRSVEDRIAQWTQTPIENGEQFYLLRYEVGQEYKPHHDYFHLELPGMESYVGKSGNRFATILMYLEAPIAGGETNFPELNITETVKKGTALLFYSATPDSKVDPLSAHGSLPVIEGTKWCCTKWIRFGHHHSRKRIPDL